MPAPAGPPCCTVTIFIRYLISIIRHSVLLPLMTVNVTSMGSFPWLTSGHSFKSFAWSGRQYDNIYLAVIMLTFILCVSMMWKKPVFCVQLISHTRVIYDHTCTARAPPAALPECYFQVKKMFSILLNKKKTYWFFSLRLTYICIHNDSESTQSTRRAAGDPWGSSAFWWAR